MGHEKRRKLEPKKRSGMLERYEKTTGQIVQPKEGRSDKRQTRREVKKTITEELSDRRKVKEMKTNGEGD